MVEAFGRPVFSKIDQFLENFQTAFDPPKRTLESKISKIIAFDHLILTQILFPMHQNVKALKALRAFASFQNERQGCGAVEEIFLEIEKYILWMEIVVVVYL